MMAGRAIGIMASASGVPSLNFNLRTFFVMFGIGFLVMVIRMIRMNGGGLNREALAFSLCISAFPAMIACAVIMGLASVANDIIVENHYGISDMKYAQNGETMRVEPGVDAEKVSFVVNGRTENGAIRADLFRSTLYVRDGSSNRLIEYQSESAKTNAPKSTVEAKTESKTSTKTKGAVVPRRDDVSYDYGSDTGEAALRR